MGLKIADIPHLKDWTESDVVLPSGVYTRAMFDVIREVEIFVERIDPWGNASQWPTPFLKDDLELQLRQIAEYERENRNAEERSE